jgi:hypothetical protein
MSYFNHRCVRGFIHENMTCYSCIIHIYSTNHSVFTSSFLFEYWITYSYRGVLSLTFREINLLILIFPACNLCTESWKRPYLWYYKGDNGPGPFMIIGNDLVRYNLEKLTFILSNYQFYFFWQYLLNILIFTIFPNLATVRLGDIAKIAMLEDITKIMIIRGSKYI